MNTPATTDRKVAMIRYRPCGDTGKWLSLFVGRKSELTRGVLGCLGWIVALPMVSLSFAFGSGGYVFYRTASLEHPWLLLLLLPFLYLGVRGAEIMFQPTHIEIGEGGLRVLRLQIGSKAKLIPWKDIREISIVSPSQSTSAEEQVLRFEMVRADERPFDIKLGGLVESNGAEELLTALQRWGKTVPKDLQVLSTLEKQQENTYTELWLQNLAQPPQRERLTPLPVGAMLKENMYKVTAVIGGGGQGTAYLSTVLKPPTQEHFPQNVVLKEYILPLHVTRDARKGSVERLQNEAKLLRALDHRQVVRLLDFFIEDHRGYLVLEQITGESLRQKVKRDGALSSSLVTELALQMCDILEYLHGQTPPVVHRDFTPDNLMLDGEGWLHLIDFNVAMQTSSNTTATVVGKHAYLPPEQFSGKPVVQSDIYAMGGTLHFLLTGEEPEPLSVSHPMLVNSSVAPELDWIVEHCTAIEARERLSDADAIRQKLRLA